MSELFPVRSMAVEVFRCEEEEKTDAFNRWYDKVRIPQLRQLPGVVSVHRYIARDWDFGEYTPDNFKVYWNKPVRFMTIYRINSAHPECVLKEIREASQSDSFEGYHPLETALYDFYAVRRRIQPLLKQPETHLPDGMPNLILLIPNQNYKRDLEMIDDWWLYTHAHDLMETPGYVECSRYHNVSPDYQEGDPSALNIYEIDSDDPIHHPEIQNMIEDRQRFREGRIPTYLKSPASRETYLCGIFEHWDIMSAI